MQNTAVLYGGALIGQHCLVNATNTKIVGNQAIWAGGGGLKLMSGVGLFKNCEIRDNRAVFGGGFDVRAGAVGLRLGALTKMPVRFVGLRQAVSTGTHPPAFRPCTGHERD